MSGIIRLIVGEAVDEGVVLTANGVGYKIETPRRLPKGEHVHLWCVHIVNERGQKLYGFETAEEREVFEALTTVKGVGGAVAIQILSQLGADGVRRAVATQNAKALSAAKGVGGKTAEMIVVELAGKLGEPDETGSEADRTLMDTVVAVLGRLEIDETKARQLVVDQLAETENATVEELVKGALTQLGGLRG